MTNTTNQNNQIVRKNANKVVWVEYWMEHMDKSREKESIDAEKDSQGYYVCTIELPFNNHVVKVRCKDHVDAVVRAAEMACEAIEEYTKCHPEEAIQNPLAKYDYEIYVDENDNLFIEMNKECRKRISDELYEIQSKTMEVINKAIEELQKIHGITDQLYLHITAKDIYGEETSVEDIWEMQEMEIEKNTNRTFLPVISYEKDKYVVTVAHLGKKE